MTARGGDRTLRRELSDLRQHLLAIVYGPGVASRQQLAVIGVAAIGKGFE